MLIPVPDLVLPQVFVHCRFNNSWLEIIKDIVVVLACFGLHHQLVELFLKSLPSNLNNIICDIQSCLKMFQLTSIDLSGSCDSVHCFILMSTLVLNVPVLKTTGIHNYGHLFGDWDLRFVLISSNKASRAIFRSLQMRLEVFFCWFLVPISS